MKKILNNFRLRLKVQKPFSIPFTLIFLLTNLALNSLHATPDLTITGYIMPEDGLGKIPLTILETLEGEVSANIKFTRQSSPRNLSPFVDSALSNPDQTPGKVALHTDAIRYTSWTPSSHVPKESLIKIAYSMFETTRIPESWVIILNEEFDAVVVPDDYLVQAYQDSGVTIPMFVLPIPMLLNDYYALPIHPDEPSTPFVFLDASANKNPASLVHAFALAFGNNPHVQLHMRAGHLLQGTKHTVEHLCNEFGLTNVFLEGGFISLEEFRSRLTSADCYVNLSRGEGFSFIPREALALGVPVIVTDNTASSTICKSGYVRPVPSEIKASPLDGYRGLVPGSCGEQFDCTVEDAAAALLDVYENYNFYLQKAREGRNWVDQYNCANPNLKERYHTLIKPKKVMLGTMNVIETEKIITTCPNLYDKYQMIIQDNLKSD